MRYSIVDISEPPRRICVQTVFDNSFVASKAIGWTRLKPVPEFEVTRFLTALRCSARGLRHKEEFIWELLRHDFAALDSPSQAQGHLVLYAQVVP